MEKIKTYKIEDFFMKKDIEFAEKLNEDYEGKYPFHGFKSKGFKLINEILEDLLIKREDYKRFIKREEGRCPGNFLVKINWMGIQAFLGMNMIYTFRKNNDLLFNAVEVDYYASCIVKEFRDYILKLILIAER